MTELDLNTLALGWITTYGASMLAVVLLLGAMGVPLPGTLLVIASGAFIRQNFLSLYTTPVLALAGVVAGDIIVYGLGCFAQGWIQKRFGGLAAWQKAQAYFNRRGGAAIYLTRWLLTPLAVPTNLVVGSSGYPFSRFLFFDVAGEITWILLYGGLGYTFGTQWKLIGDFISNFTGLAVGVVALGMGVYLLLRFRKQSVVEPAPAKAKGTG